jgi:ribulose-5-phosphate 4-epimerase/fuculose-1-phosphate aldolase
MNAPEKMSGLQASQQRLGGANAPKMPSPPVFSSVEDERLHRKQRLAGVFRLFSRFGFDEGVAGHVTARDPEFQDTFWVNPYGMHFSQINVSSLIRVDHHGNVVEGKHPVNAAAFAIHSAIHAARPDVIAAAHTHSIYGRAWAALDQPLAMINQDVCAFYQDHALYTDYGGVVIDAPEGDRLVKALGMNKAAILSNHGLLTVADSVDAAAWWYIAMERCCQVQLLAQAAAAGKPLKLITKESAEQVYSITGSAFAGWFQFQPLWDRIVKEQPDFLK